MPDSDNQKNNKTTDDSPSTVTPKYNKARRRLLATLGTGGAIGAAASGWVSPVIESVVLPAHAQASGDTGTVDATSCTDTDNAGVGNWNVYLYRDADGSGGDVGWDESDTDLDGSTHNYVVSLSSSNTNRAYGISDIEFNLDFGNAGKPDTTNITATLNGSWSAVSNTDETYDADSGSFNFWAGDMLDGIFANNGYNPGGVTLTVTTSDCSQAFNVTVNP